MQLALPSDSPGAELVPSASPMARRASKFLLAGAAAVGVAAIAAQPTAQNIPAIQELQARAVQLVADVTTSDPAEVYQGLLTNTFTNLSTLGTQLQANPFPLLSQIAENQEGYAARFGTAFDTAEAQFQTFWETGTRESKISGQAMLENIQTALAAGDFNTAYSNLNNFVLYGIQNSLLPVLSTTIFGTATNPGIPQAMAQNVTDAIGAFLTTGTLAFGAFQSVFSPVSGASFEASRALQAVSTAVQSGDVQGALTGLVNTPGDVTNAFLNGFDYNDADTTEAWSGLFSPKGTRASGGPISQFLITIPAKIAAAIDNTPTTAATATTATPAAITSKDVAATDIAATDIASTDVTKSVSTLTLAPKVKAAKTAKTTDTATTDAANDSATATDTAVAAKPAKKQRATGTSGTSGTNVLKAASDGVSAAVKNVSDGVKQAAAGGRHASNKDATAKASDSKPKHAKASDSD